MNRPKYIEHIQELELIRKDVAMSPEILTKVDELQLLLTNELHMMLTARAEETKGEQG